MAEDKEQLVDEETMEKMSVAPPEPNERAFTGHPDHPPQVPDQTPEANQELIGGDDAPERDAPAIGD